jgi:hypothetical protein
MNKSEIRSKVIEILQAGVGKSEAFSRLSVEAANDKFLATCIASHAGVDVRQKYGTKVYVLMGLLTVFATVKFLILFSLLAEASPALRWGASGFSMLILLAFVWGFYKYSEVAYKLFIVLSISQSSKLFDGFEQNPMFGLITLGVAAGFVFFVWHLKGKLFPDMGFFSPKKVNGQFIFST